MLTVVLVIDKPALPDYVILFSLDLLSGSLVRHLSCIGRASSTLSPHTYRIKPFPKKMGADVGMA